MLHVNRYWKKKNRERRFFVLTKKKSDLNWSLKHFLLCHYHKHQNHNHHHQSQKPKPSPKPKTKPVPHHPDHHHDPNATTRVACFSVLGHGATLPGSKSDFPHSLVQHFIFHSQVLDFIFSPPRHGRKNNVGIRRERQKTRPTITTTTTLATNKTKTPPPKPMFKVLWCNIVGFHQVTTRIVDAITKIVCSLFV